MDLRLQLEKILERYQSGNPNQKLITKIMDLFETPINISIKELEEFLITIRELKDKYEDIEMKTGGDIVRIDELRQLEFKVTELIFENR